MKSFFSEFKEFAMRGNVMDLAVAVIIGAAFQAIVASFTDDLVSPILGIFGHMDLSSYVLNINGAELRYGSFITAVINFIITAFIIFLLVKALNKLSNMGKKEEEADPQTKECPYCFSEISIHATRCPHCTSVLEESATQK